MQMTILDTKDELDERLERHYNVVSNLITGLSEREVNDTLNAFVGKGSQQHEEITLGLLYSILTNPKQAPRSYRDLTLVTRDMLGLVLLRSNQLIFEKWQKLLDSTRHQIVWFCKELVKNGVANAESVCHSLLRQVAGGDITQKNVWLAEAMLDLFTENRVWLDKNPGLVPTVVFTYLRVITDHGNPSLSVLRQRESEFCVSLLREKWTDCIVIGRDLVRLLQSVARIPEFDSLWRDIMLNPTSINSQFTGVEQLLRMRTSRKFLVSRLTPEMENKLLFLITKVRFGQQKRYQDWFQRQYLSTPESQSLRCDLIRYICAVFHPPNELLCSDIIPRWAVIGWLLTTCTSNVAASSAKLALFYDWLLFDPEKDSIMNIEPAILVMYHSMRPHPAITATLLDFLCRIMANFYPALSDLVKQGIFTSLASILEKRVLQSLSPLFDNPKLDRELRSLIKENFSKFCSADIKEPIPEVNPTIVSPVVKEVGELIDNSTPNHVNDSNNLAPPEGVFSDDEDDIPLDKLKQDLGERFKPIQSPNQLEKVDVTEFLQQLEGDIKDLTLQLQDESDQANQCELMDRLVQAVIQDDEFDQETSSYLAQCLCQLLSGQFNNNILPKDINDDSIEDSIGTPLFVMFRNLAAMATEDPSRQPLLQVLGDMYNKQAKIGYHLLYFLKVCKGNDDKMSTYKDFCQSLDKDAESCLMQDLKLCQEDDVRLFTFLLPDIYTQFPTSAVGNSSLLYMIVSSIDGTQLQDLICHILQGHLILFRKDSFLSVLNASLEWETLEQYFLWQLISAHNIPVEHIMPILPKLDFVFHAEALTSLMVLLKQECPSTELLRSVLSRDCKKQDLFAVSVLKYWAQEYEDRLAEIIYNQLTKVSTTPKKRQRVSHSAKKDKDNPSVDQILSHLDHMRQVCKNASFLNNEQIQHALQQVQGSASDSQKTKFSDLLALAEDLDDIRTTRVLRGRKASINSSPKHSSKPKKPVEDSGESTEVSSEEEDIRPKSKKRKKSSLVEDDSD